MGADYRRGFRPAIALVQEPLTVGWSLPRSTGPAFNTYIAQVRAPPVSIDIDVTAT